MNYITIKVFLSTIDTILSDALIENCQTDCRQKDEIIKKENWSVYSFCFKTIDTLIDSLCSINIKNYNNNHSNEKFIQLETSLLPIIFETINNLVLTLFETRNEWLNLNLVFKKLKIYNFLSYLRF